MRLVFIRHAEPDYEHNTLTEKGFREAQILSDRVTKWNVDHFYVSPLRRAQLTAEPSLVRMGRTADTVDWLQEFSYIIIDPLTGERHVPWDFMPEYWTKDEKFYDRDRFYEQEVLSSNPKYIPAVQALRTGLDRILEDYGYHRSGWYYRTEDDKTEGDDDTTIVFFGHLGANSEALGYLLGISPVVIQESIYMAPTSVTIVNFEKRLPGAAQARAQLIGDVRHLTEAGEPISRYGAFSAVTDM